MSILVQFFWVLLFVGIWFGLGLFNSKITQPFLRLCYCGVRGSVLSLVFSAFIALLVSHSGLVQIPDESRTYIFIMMLLGLGMISAPVAFLISMAKAQGIQE